MAEINMISQCLPPRRGTVVALAVDSTARPYDLSTLIFDITQWDGSGAPEGSLKGRKQVVLFMQAETNDVYFAFSPTSQNDLNDTSKISAGSAMAASTAYGGMLKAGTGPFQFTIDRFQDRWLIVKAASTAGVLRFWAGSDEE